MDIKRIIEHIAVLEMSRIIDAIQGNAAPPVQTSMATNLRQMRDHLIEQYREALLLELKDEVRFVRGLSVHNLGQILGDNRKLVARLLVKRLN